MSTVCDPTKRKVERYVEGTVVHVLVDVSVDCVAQDPSGISVTVRRPDKSVTVYTFGVNPEVERATSGEYFIDLPTAGFPGRWRYYWQGTGNNAGADQWEFVVLPRATQDDD